MECLKNLIGVRCGKSVDDPDTRMWVNELPGISIVRASLTADDEYGTGEALLLDAVAFASKVVPRDFLQRLFSKSVFFKEVIDQSRFGGHGASYLPAGSGWVGFDLSVCVDPYVEGYLDYFEIKVRQDAAAVPIHIYNGCDVFIYEADLKCGVNRIDVQQHFVERLYVLVDTTDVEISDGTTSRTIADNCGTCRDSCGCVSATGIHNTGELCEDLPPINCTYQQSPTLNGFVVYTYCKGSADKLICKFRDYLVLPMLYRAGAHIMESIVSSNRANPYVRNTKDEARELLARWMGGTEAVTGYEIKGEYPKLLDYAVSSVAELVKTSDSLAFRTGQYHLGDSVRPLHRPRVKLRERALKQNLLNL